MMRCGQLGRSALQRLLVTRQSPVFFKQSARCIHSSSGAHPNYKKWAVGAVAVGVAGCFALQFLPSATSWKTKYRVLSAERALQNKQYDDAIEYLLFAIRDESDTGEAIVNLRDRLANVYLETRQWSNAVAVFKDVIKGLLLHGRKENDDAIVEISIKISKCFRKQGNERDAAIGARWAVAAMKAKLKETFTVDEKENRLALLGMGLDELAVCVEQQGDYQSALSIRFEALAAAQEMGHQHNALVALAANKVAQTLVALERLDEAEQALALACSVSSPPDVAVYLANRASVLHRLHKSIEAQDCIAQARAAAAGDADMLAGVSEVAALLQSPSAPAVPHDDH